MAGYIETIGMVTSNLTSKTVTSTVKRGQNGVVASPIIISRGPPTPPSTGDPVWPRFTVDVTVFEVKFDVTAFDVNIFRWYHFSMLPYSMLFASIHSKCFVVEQETCVGYSEIQSVSHLDYWSKMIFLCPFWPLLERAPFFRGSWGSSENRLELETKSP